MLRYRRYRVFLVFAGIALFALYHLSTSDTPWRLPAVNMGDHAPGREEGDTGLSWHPKQEVVQETNKFDVHIPAATDKSLKQTPPPIAPVRKPFDDESEELAATSVEDAKKGQAKPVVTQAVEDQQVPLVIVPTATSPAAIHWKKQTEHFPLPSVSLMKLPTGKPKPMRKIQFDFKEESAAAENDRQLKLDAIRSTFKKSWDGYKKYAWLHDELKPLSNYSKDPFAGWGATLVDALDTLWIMGLKEEFEEAAEAVNKIDFTTTHRADIPLFETTIRYLGGLLAAFEISGKQHQVLLKKSLELAEILLSAFDTPNRMPDMYYYWRPDFTTNAHRASNRVVLAEIGSLSMEFTKLAQLSGENKYYDAVARITDNLADFQNRTRLQGMWPVYLDASGCKRIDYTADVTQVTDNLVSVERKPKQQDPRKDMSVPMVKPKDDDESEAEVPLELPAPVIVESKKSNSDSGSSILNNPSGSLRKRQLQLNNEDPLLDAAASAPVETRPACAEQRFESSSDYAKEEYTLGGMSDSTYEYLSKQYLLLGGLVEKYQSMYEQSMDVVKKHLIFRPMLPNEDDILVSGKFHVSASFVPGEPIGDLEAEQAHLTCFAGGMFGMGAKIFDRPDDLEIAKKLTEGCIWSYNMTATGIMPEAFTLIPCESASKCPWNETQYWELLDPASESRQEQYKNSLSAYEEQYASATAWYDAQMKAMETPAPTIGHILDSDEVAAIPTPAVLRDILDKKRIDDSSDIQPAALKLKMRYYDGGNGVERPVSYGSKVEQPSAQKFHIKDWDTETDARPPTNAQPFQGSLPPTNTLPVFLNLYSPKVPLSHKEFVANRIKEERLPLGVVKIQARNYILRPEAIESVFYMYRITGDPYYRSAGWQMFQSVALATTASSGNSAIDDVTKTVPLIEDSMESFWLAETLKYFYLLFEKEDVLSLDEWVFNTEAHGFERPKAGGEG